PEVVELVPPARGGAVLALGGVVLVERLTVATDRDPLPHAVYLGCGGPEALHRGVGLDHHVPAEPEFLERAGHRPDLLLELPDAGGVGLLGGRGGGGEKRERGDRRGSRAGHSRSAPEVVKGSCRVTRPARAAL